MTTFPHNCLEAPTIIAYIWNMNLGNLLKELSEHWQRDLIFALIAALIVDFVLKGPIRKFFVSVLRRKRELAASKRFEQNYRDWLINRFRFLNVRGIKPHAPVTVELERVFVSLKTKKPPERQDALLEESERELLEDSKQEQREFLERTLLRKEEERLQAEKNYEVKDLFSLPQKRFIVIGKPGSGKTTLLSFLALKFARRSAEELFGSDDEMLPVFVNLRDTIKQGFLDVKTFGEKYDSYIECPHSAPTDLFKQRLNDGKCLVLLDGLDEVSKPEERVDVARWVDRLTSAYPKNVFLATSRPYGYETTRLYNDFLELHILDFTPEQVEEFVRYWTKAVEIKARGDESDFTLKEAEKKAEDLLKAVKESPKIEVLTVNPLLLTIVSLVHRYRATLPKRRVELYEECCDILLGYWDTAKGMASELQPRQKRTVLQPLAYHFHRNGLREQKRERVVELLKGELPKIGVSEDEAGELLDDIRHRCGMLVETKLGYFGFAHLTFQEFLTARYILDNHLEDFLVATRRDKYWLEVTLLYCGMKDTTTLLRKISDEKEDIFCSNLFAAGRCLAESLSVAPEIRTDINQSLLRVCWDESEFEELKGASWEILREIKDPRTIGDLVDKTRDKESDVRRRAADALGQIQAKESVPPLIELLKDKKTDVRGHAVYALGQIQAKESVPPLIELLKDKERYVRGRAIYALGRIQAKEAVPPLIELLKDKESDVRRRAADALGQIQAKESVPPLIELLKDKKTDVRGHAVYALGQIQAKESVPPLIELLKDKERYVRGHAVYALGQIQVKEAVPPLIELLKDKESDVGSSAAFALGEIQAEEAVFLLIQLLKHEDSGVRLSAASALGAKQAEEAVLPLIELLKNRETDVRGFAAVALAQTGAKEAVLPLVELLEDKESSVRGFAAFALGILGAKEAILSLIELLKDKESYVRGGAAFALGGIQAKEAVAPLIELLKDKESNVRRHAAEALGKIGEARAVEPLKSLLTDTEVGVTFKAVRESAFAALREISDKTGTPIYGD